MSNALDSLRTHRLFGIALFDVIAAYLGVFLFHNVLVGDGKLFTSNAQLFVSVIPIGVLAHVMFNQKTFLNSMIFDVKEFNGYKLVFLVLLLTTFFL